MPNALRYPIVLLSMLGSASLAHADTYEYTYVASRVNLVGNFEATISGVGSSLSTTSGFSNFTGTGIYYGAPVFVSEGSGNISASLGTVQMTIHPLVGTATANPGAAGSVSGDGNSFSFGSAVYGLFSAVNQTPSSGGSSGGAPSPEINALLGLALAVGTFAFLRRKRVAALA